MKRALLALAIVIGAVVAALGLITGLVFWVDWYLTLKSPWNVIFNPLILGGVGVLICIFAAAYDFLGQSGWIDED